MSRTTAFLADVAQSLVRTLLRRPSTGTTPRPTSKRPHPSQRPSAPQRPASPGAPVEKGRSGATATVEVDPATVGTVRMTYSPQTDGDPDPGEIVWTWVPYEENDGRGKDRPVVVVATETGGTVLAVQLTSKKHDGDGEFVSLGTGPWDAEGRPSWVNLERVLRVYPAGMRREAAALDATRYARVEKALQARYRWT